MYENIMKPQLKMKVKTSTNKIDKMDTTESSANGNARERSKNFSSNENRKLGTFNTSS